MKEKKIAIENYERFCKLDGSDFIASEFALEVILKIIKTFNVCSILELGLGIGSISDTVLKYSKANNRDISYFGTERNEFCLEALKKNVIQYRQIELYSELNQLKKIKFDLIIIDGYDDTFNEIVEYCKKHTILFIEGDRKDQTLTIKQIFAKCKHVNVITLNKNKPYSHGGGDTNRYVGGGQLIFINPSFFMKLFWFKEKVATFFKNKIRTYKFK